MAKSLKGLIEFLLEEISLRGDQGVAASVVLEFIDQFYARSQDGANGVSRDDSTNDANRVHNVDLRFKSHVWKWLAKHPEVSIGKNREGNGLSLTEVVAGSRDNENQSVTGQSNGTSKQNGELHVFVSRERMWLAITGHEPDVSRVLPLEFALLSIIASRKGDGIVQSDLVQLSGQDKRSVPQRTDSLHQKGYIEKKAIQYKSARTSLCTLAKFAGSAEARLSYILSPLDGAASELNKYKVIDFSVLLTKLFTFLKEFQVISREDLKRKMEMQDRWHAKILRRAIQKLEVIGCIRRVRAISQYHKFTKSRHASVMLLREPTSNDIRLFHEDISSLVTSLESGGVEDEELAQEETIDETPEIDPLLQVSKEEFVVDAGRKSPHWNPDRNLPNMIFDVVNRAGTNGTSNQDITTEIMGIFFRRPLEATLSRLTEHWQFSQPLHLRHLAIVRDSALSGTIHHYVHYSFENFASLVTNGDSTWEAIESRSIPGKNAPKALAMDAKPTLDKYGFPISDGPPGLLKKGNATLRQCLEAVKPWTHAPPMRGPAVVKRGDGSYGLEFVKARHRTAAAHLADRPLKRKYDSTGSRQSSPVPDLPEEGDGQPLSMFKRRALAKLGHGAEVSEKERLEALGLDETWTEYKVLLIERPTPGIYITLQGKRRPVGKRQGRPGKSRIAVFKLPKLKELDWFTAGEPELSIVDTNGEVESAPAEVSEESPSGTHHPRPKRAVAQHRVYRSLTPDSRITEHAQRGSPESGLDDEFEVEEAVPKIPTPRRKRKRQQETEGQQSKRQRPLLAKQVSPETVQGHPEESQSLPTQGAQTADANVEVPTSLTVIQGQEVTSTQQNGREVPLSAPHDHPLESKSGEPAEPISEGIDSTDRSKPNNGESEAERAETPLQLENGEELAEQMPETPRVTEKEKTLEPLVELHSMGTPSNVSSVAKQKKKREMRGGSVAFLRKKILLDVLDQAGGLCPMGTELWYPFATAWLKTKQTTRPDMRTVRNTAKSLIEAGKLQQFTFSGRNSKGIVVTKSILATPEHTPDGQATMDMQRAMLNADPQLYFPPGVDIDPTLRKSNRSNHTLAEHTMKLPPIEGEIRVMLHQAPAVAKPRSERRWTPRPIGGAEALLNLSLERHAYRLKTIRRSAQGRSYLTSTTYPTQEGGSHPLPVLSKRSLLRFRSKMNAATSMLMFPPQDFHTLSGTFGTGISMSKKAPRGSSKFKPQYAQNRAPRSSENAVASMLMSPPQGFHAPSGTFGTGIRMPRKLPRGSSKFKAQYAQRRVPPSLEDAVTLLGNRRANADEIEGPDAEHFFYDVDIVKQWEHENPTILDIKDGDHHFINHVVEGPFNSVTLEGDVRFGSGEAPPKRATRLLLMEKLSAPCGPFTYPSRNQDFGDGKAPRRLTQLHGTKSDGPARSRPEGAQKLTREVTTIPESTERRLMTTIIVMRALAGGMEGKMVDWGLVAPMFPSYSSKFIHDRGRVLVAKHRLQLIKMQSDFQDRFLEAYEKNQLPPIDYNKLEAYDWEGIVDWAEKNLERPLTDRQLSLPATRKQFDSLFEIRKLPANNIDEVYQHNTSMTLPRKRAVYSNTIFASTLPQEPVYTPPKPPHGQLLEVAKTWVRANVATPEETYRGAEARQTLQRFTDDLINESVQSLVTERVISQGGKGRLVPGRNFDLTEHFITTLTRKRAVESAQLKRAAHFKTAILDPAMQSDGKFNVQYAAEDGDILALTNLIARGHIVVIPKNPPRNKYGLTEGGYLTRMMDKGKLRFEVELRPVPDRYTYGNPIEQSIEQAAIPRGDLGDSINPTTAFVLPKIPLWFDVHVQFVKILWDIVVAAVLGIFAARPGVGVKVITRMLDPCLAEWELKLVLDWMVDARLIRSIGDKSGEFGSYQLEEWWWMALAQ